MKKYIIVILILIGLLISGCTEKEKEKITPEQKPLNLVEEENTVIEEVEPQLPGALLVMVDNYYKARPQSGLDKADIVYEIVAESGITRFMAIYYQQKVEKIGPIRSARDYFVKLARGYDGPLAHAGGSQAALAMIQEIKMKDLDEIYNSGPYFWRDRNRKMPHNLYSSSDKLMKGAEKRGYKLEPPYMQPEAKSWDGEKYGEEISLDYSVGKYKYLVTWCYQNSSYTRKINNTLHVMEDGIEITADNVIVMAAKTSIYIKDGVPLSDVGIVGKGDARYFINGLKMNGYWQKETVYSPIKFYDSNGNLMSLKKGRTWIQVTSDLKRINGNDKV